MDLAVSPLQHPKGSNPDSTHPRYPSFRSGTYQELALSALRLRLQLVHERVLAHGYQPGVALSVRFFNGGLCSNQWLASRCIKTFSKLHRGQSVLSTRLNGHTA